MGNDMPNTTTTGLVKQSTSWNANILLTVAEFQYPKFESQIIF